MFYVDESVGIHTGTKFKVATQNYFVFIEKYYPINFTKKCDE